MFKDDKKYAAPVKKAESGGRELNDMHFEKAITNKDGSSKKKK